MNAIRSFFFFILGVFVSSCIGGQRNSPQILPATELAFGDFVLDGSFRECYEKASQNPIYKDLSAQKDDLLDYALFSSVEIPFYDVPDISMTVYKGEVRSYKGRIYSVRYESNMVSTIIKMYQAKYGSVKPKKHEYEERDLFGPAGLTNSFVDITQYCPLKIQDSSLKIL